MCFLDGWRWPVLSAAGVSQGKEAADFAEHDLQDHNMDVEEEDLGGDDDNEVCVPIFLCSHSVFGSL